MGITMFVSLYSTRLVLSALGASDFGVFNVVGGSIAMMGFLNSTLAHATQRFMSYAEGEGQLESKRCVFNVSLVLHLLIALVTILLLFAAMPILFHRVFNLEPDRLFAARIVYYSLIVSTGLTIINVPYDAVMNAHENMLYYSIVGVFESVLKLVIAIICVHTTLDKLIVYGILMACIPLITLNIMKIYCHHHYKECVIAPRRYWNEKTVKQISTFFGWNFLTAFSSLFSSQGIGLVLNHFFGTVLNAAQGIANQLNSYMAAFSENMMKALNPIIVKKAGAQDMSSMRAITMTGCKFSTVLLLLFTIPCILEMPYILQLWLKDVPDWTVVFCSLQLIQSSVCQVVRSVATAIYAQGNIKEYAIYKSLMNAAPVFLTLLCFLLGGGPIWLYIPMIVVWGIGGDCVVLYYAHKECGLDIRVFIHEVVFPIIGISIVSVLFGLSSRVFFSNNLLRLAACILLSSFGLIASLVIFGTTVLEKRAIIDPFLQKIRTVLRH